MYFIILYIWNLKKKQRKNSKFLFSCLLKFLWFVPEQHKNIFIKFIMLWAIWLYRYGCYVDLSLVHEI